MLHPAKLRRSDEAVGPIGESPRALWDVDLSPAISTSSRPHLIIFVDNLSLYITGTLIPNRNAETITKSFFDHVLLPYGIPRAVRSDNELNTSSFRALCAEQGIQFMPISPHNPQSNGIAELSIAKCKRAIRSLIKVHARNFENFLPRVFDELNDIPSSTHGITPKELFFGRSVNTFKLVPSSGRYSQEEIQNLTRLAHRRRFEAQKDRAEKLNASRDHSRHIHVGSIVCWKNLNVPSARTALSRNTLKGPGIVIDKLHDHAFMIMHLIAPYHVVRVHRTHTYLFNSNGAWPNNYFESIANDLKHSDTTSSPNKE